MNNNDRFQKVAGDEYFHLKKAYPHFDEFQETIGVEVAKHVEPKMALLEIGTGVGYTLKPLISSLGNADVTIMAIDTRQEDLDLAAADIKDGRVKYLNADIFELLPSLKESSIDIIFSGHTLHNFKKDERAMIFAEIKRVLKPGGLFVNGDRYAYDDKKKQTDSIQEQLDLYEKFLPKIPVDLCKEWSDHIIEDENWKFLESEQLKYFPNGKFIFRLRNEGVFVATNI